MGWMKATGLGGGSASWGRASQGQTVLPPFGGMKWAWTQKTLAASIENEQEMGEKEKPWLSADPKVLAWVQEECRLPGFPMGDRGAPKSRLLRPVRF